MHIPAHLPLEEAMEYAKTVTDLTTKGMFRSTALRPKVGDFADFVLGHCPVREGQSLWLIDQSGHIWTSRMWHPEGELVECWNGVKLIETDWPKGRDDADYSYIYDHLQRRGARWGNEGYILAVEEFDETYVGPWDGMDEDQRAQLRALMIYGFDQEWGKGAFTRSIGAGRLKHQKATYRIRRKERLTAPA